MSLNIIIIGDSYNFSQLELDSLKKKHHKLFFIKGISSKSSTTIAKLESPLKNKLNTLIVTNSTNPISSELITYFTKIEQQNGVHFLTIKSFLEQYLNKIYIPKTLTGMDFSEKIHPYTRFEFIQKRIVDYIGAFGLVFLFWPVMAYSLYRIKKDSPDGPIFFKQDRVGICSKEFSCIKFRSMIQNAEKNGVQFASEDDPRIFPWGKIMRKTRIDELPQVINILKGEMHLVGPRPERKVWVNKFEKNIPYYNERHLVRPGITGWAQVKYPYGANAEDAHQKLMYDLYYLKKWSLILEIKTLIHTVWVVLGKEGQ